MNKPDAKTIAVMAVMIAVVTVLTLVVRVPVPATNGYINFSDVAIYFAAFAFGPWVGLVAGGVGAAVADVLGGYANFALLTFFAHGLEGWVAGYLGGRTNSLQRMLLGWAAGTVVMVGLYFLGETFVMGLGAAAAGAEAPFNLLQNVAGGVLGIPLVYAVRKAYPPINQIGFGKTWKEV
jgi:energy-coupling factor transport system substrate-specific component